MEKIQSEDRKGWKDRIRKIGREGNRDGKMTFRLFGIPMITMISHQNQNEIICVAISFNVEKYMGITQQKAAHVHLLKSINITFTEM